MSSPTYPSVAGLAGPHLEQGPVLGMRLAVPPAVVAVQLIGRQVVPERGDAGTINMQQWTAQVNHVTIQPCNHSIVAALPQVAQLPRHRLEQRPAGIKALTLHSTDGEQYFMHVNC